MKKLLLIAGLAFFAMTTTSTVCQAQTNTVSINWVKSSTGTWIGSDRLSYKLNATDKSVWISKDNGTNWEAVKSGQWQDKAGKWMKIDSGKLVWSADQGKSWTEVPNWTWEGGDSKMNKFDASWNLMMKKIK